ncbi:WAC domain-containing protein [Balamuthia mandrillaris]
MSVLSNAGFTLLSMSEKLEILCLLCHAALDSSAIRECMNESLLNAKDILNEDHEIKENAKPENGVKGNAIERMIAKVRYTALGMDRHYNRYWQWRGQKMNIGQPRVYVEFPPSSTSSGDTSATSSPKSSVEKSTWGYYDTPEQVEQLLSFLDERGNREQKLKASLLKKRSKIEDDMKGKASRFSHQHLLAMGEVRRSSRLQRQQHPSDGSMSSASSSSSALLGSSTQYVNLYRQQK